jgi:undecaprenyl pyrophosphate synthase
MYHDALCVCRASQRGLPRTAGHIEGAKRAREIIDVCRALGVKVSIALRCFAY